MQIFLERIKTNQKKGVFMKISAALALTIIISTSIYAHSDHSSHTWLGDKSAYEYNKTQTQSFMKNLKAISNKSNSQVIADQYISEIDETYLKDKLKNLSGVNEVNIGTRVVKITERKSSKGRLAAREYLAMEYRDLGYKVSFSGFGGFSKGSNMIAEKISTHPDALTLVLSSHYDSVGNAGANDNGSGTISALAVAKALSSQQFKHSIVIIAFDKEESGLVGSKAYVKSIKDKSKIMGNINFEMMGTNSRGDGAFHIIDCDRADSSFLTKAVTDTISGYNLPLAVNPGCTNRSDHASFWKQNIPAVVISENFFGGDSDKCYHKKCDVVDSRLDFTYMRHITYSIYGAIVKLLQ